MKWTVFVMIASLFAGAACSSNKSKGSGPDAMAVVTPDGASDSKVDDAKVDAVDGPTPDVADASTEATDLAMSDAPDVPTTDAIDTAISDATDGRGEVSPLCALGIDLRGPCDGLCSALAASCSDVANRQFADFDTCVSACNAPTWSCGAPDDQTGNTVFCRFNHAVAAGTAADPAAECRNGGPNSPVCL
jgi:hypothetical protein